MPINATPIMTPILVKAGAFSSEPFTLVDVGARGGTKDHWRVFGQDLRFFGFDADPEEAQRLQQKAPPGAKIFPFGLGGQNETRTLHIHYNATGSSLYEADPLFLKRMLLDEAAATVKEQPIELRRLDDIVADIGDLDFIDVDAEGAELEIMQAGINLIGRTETLGVFTEVRFLDGYNTPLFWQADQFLRGLGFSIYDLSFLRESRRALPYPMIGDQRRAGDPEMQIFGPTIGGQMAYGDALYLRDVVGKKATLSTTKLLKLACIFEIFGQNDSAAELILANRKSIDKICSHRQLLDALVPVVQRTKLPYDEYVARFFRYDPLFRSVPGGSKEEIYAAVRQLAVQLVRDRRHQRALGKVARFFLGNARVKRITGGDGE
jgi:FkbM family methyltransferase